MAEIDFNGPIETTTGDRVVILSTLAPGNYNVLGYVAGVDVVYRWNSRGVSSNTLGPTLVQTPEERTKYFRLVGFTVDSCPVTRKGQVKSFNEILLGIRYKHGLPEDSFILTAGEIFDELEDGDDE